MFRKHYVLLLFYKYVLRRFFFLSPFLSACNRKQLPLITENLRLIAESVIVFFFFITFSLLLSFFPTLVFQMSVQAGKHDWFLLMNPIDHIQMLSETSFFVQLEHGQCHALASRVPYPMLAILR